MTTVGSKLINYSHADYIPVLHGDVIIYREYAFLTHTTNLTAYSEIIEDTRKLVDLFPQSHVKKILTSDTDHIDTLLSSINVHHRHVRSLNFIGTALKVIAGTPDFDDFENIHLKQEQLINSNNRQIQINTKIQIQIQKLTDTVNTILTGTKREQIDSGHLFEILLARNRMLIINLQNLIMSITMAKINITNPMILDNDDIKLIMNSEHSTNVSVSEILSMSKIKVLQSSELLYFIIKYPICETLCKKIIVFPVPHSGKIINFAGDSLVAECKDHIYPINSCGSSMTATFCKIMSNTTCAQQLVSGVMAHCKTQFNHLDPVMVIDDGLIIINDATADVEEPNNIVKKISGTYLLSFEDNVRINKTLYVNKNNAVKGMPGTPTFPVINVTEHLKILTLPLLHEMSIDNLNYIGNLQRETKTGPVLAGCITFASFAICYVAVHLIKRRIKKREAAKINTAIASVLKKTEDGLHLSKGVVNDEQ